MCHPAGRGDGSIADDVYALGVLLLTLALGRLPLAELDDTAILRRKLEQGSHGALVGDERLPPLIADLSACLLCGGAAVGGILHLLDDSLVGQGCLHRQLARQQKIRP